MTIKRYNTVFITIQENGQDVTVAKGHDIVDGYSIKENRYGGGIVIEADTTDEQHAALIALDDVSEQIGGPVPEYVSGAQAKVALHVAGHLASIEALMDHPDTDPITKIFWENTERFERQSDTINNLGAALGLSLDDIENLLRQADQIRP